MAALASDWLTLFNFSRMAERIYSKLATNVLYQVPTKCCFNFLSGIYKEHFLN